MQTDTKIDIISCSKIDMVFLKKKQKKKKTAKNKKKNKQKKPKKKKKKNKKKKTTTTKNKEQKTTLHRNVFSLNCAKIDLNVGKDIIFWVLK